MKLIGYISNIFVASILLMVNQAMCQWNVNGNHIYNTNTGNVGIGSDSPATLLHVQKNMTEPNIIVQNLGGNGGSTFTMIDNASGANWKFKATYIGGFKIRDHANLLDIIVIEPNSFANAICIKTMNNIGVGTSAPSNSALLDLTTTNKGLLLPRMTQAEIIAIPGPANGLTVFCTTDNKFYTFVAIAGNWKEILYGTSTIVPN